MARLSRPALIAQLHRQLERAHALAKASARREDVFTFADAVSVGCVIARALVHMQCRRNVTASTFTQLVNVIDEALDVLEPHKRKAA